MADVPLELIKQVLDMSEERFGRTGRHIATVLLGLGLVALFFFFIGTIVDYGVIPAWNITQAIYNEPKSVAYVVYRAGR